MLLYHNDMDRPLTTGEAAQVLGTSVPRVLRAARKGLVPSMRRGSRTVLPRSSVDELRRRWGYTPPHGELSHEELLVLAALSRRPRGVRSARRVARQAGVSPTTASRVLRRLADQGYVERSTVTEVAGVVRDVSIWRSRWDGRPWQCVASDVGQATLPSPTPGLEPDPQVPFRLAHLFWNARVRDLTVDDHAELIASRMLRSGDPEALAWMVRNVPSDAIARATRGRGMDPRAAALGRVLAHAA